MALTRIYGGLVYDGSLNRPEVKDVWIEDSRIKYLGSRPELEADSEINAEGKIVCPGFVDIHRHPDMKPFTEGWFGEAELRQGISTVVCGNCGISLTPVSQDDNNAEAQYAFDEPVLGPKVDGIPKTYPEFMDRIEKMPLPYNLGAMVGTGSVKISIKGFENTPFTDEEMKKAQDIIRESLENGAPAVSMGIMYIPECWTTKDEYVRMLAPLAERKGLFTAHIRGEGDSMVSSVDEVIDIARRTGCSLEISHFKSCGVKNWKKEIHRAIEHIEKARVEGIDVTVDFYPYNCGSTALTTMLPPAYVKGDMDSALERLGTEDGVKEFRRSTEVEYSDWDNYAVTLGWERIIISGIVNEHNRKFLGLTVTDGAEKYGFEDGAALAAYLMHDENGKTSIINMSMCQDDIDVIAKLPYSSIISDAIYNRTDTPHPRMFGAMPKVIREYVNERKLLTMEEGIHKITMQPADRMGISDRGRIEIGAYADILIFDRDRLKDNATFSDPAKCAEGIDYLFINGEIAVKDDKIVNRTLGRCLRKGCENG